MVKLNTNDIDEKQRVTNCPQDIGAPMGFTRLHTTRSSF